MTWGKPSTVDLLKEQCNRYANGRCDTRGCLVRGGYVAPGSVTYEDATCEFHEAVLAIEERDRLLIIVEAAAEREQAELDALASNSC